MNINALETREHQGLMAGQQVARNEEQENGFSFPNKRLCVSMAEVIARNVQYLFPIERGYVWYPKEDNIAFCTDARPLPPCHPPRQPSRAERRRMNREMKKQRLIDAEYATRQWRKLYKWIEKVEEDHVSPESGSVNQISSSDPVPLEYDRKEDADDVVPVEGTEQNASALPEKDTSGEIADAIHEILLELGSNGILRFFPWVIEQIALKIQEDPELRRKYLTKDGAFTRNRKITLVDLITCLLTMGGDNLAHEVYDYFKMTPVHPSVPAMVNRRKLLNAEGVEYFMKELTAVCEVICSHLPMNDDPNSITSGFKAMYAIDGSGIRIASNPDDPETYVNGADGKQGYNLYHLNCLRDDKSGLIVASILQAIAKTHETGAAVEMIRALEPQGPSLITGDRGLASLNVIETVRRKDNLEGLFRCKEGWLTETKKLPLEELDVDITIHVITTQRNVDKERIRKGEAKYLSGKSPFGKYKTSQSWDYESEVDVTFRVVRFKLDSGEWETLITTLSREKYSASVLKKLYFTRWGNIENAFRVLKWDNHLSQMHCKLDNSSRQEIFARIAMYNIVSSVIRIAESVETVIKAINSLNAEGQADSKSKEDCNKHPLQINRSFATYIVCDFLKNPDAINYDVIEMILRCKVPVRKNRSFKRDLRTIPFASFLYR